MPAINTIRSYEANQYYHIYNRGNNKQDTFFDDLDYQCFLKYLFRYTLPINRVLSMWPSTKRPILANNLHGELDVLAYCLMPNHFHLLLHQHTKDAITRLMKQLSNSYTGYVNSRHSRTGSLFQGVYRAVAISSDSSLLRASRYIHLNPIRSALCGEVDEYRWSSMHEYVNPSPSNLCSVSPVLSDLTGSDYKKFVAEVQPFDFTD